VEYAGIYGAITATTMTKTAQRFVKGFQKNWPCFIYFSNLQKAAVGF
jgi:hypothetical protein